MIGGLGGGTGLRFQASAKVIADGGRLDTYPERILVENATTATIVLTAATSYRGADPEVAVERHIAAAAHKASSGCEPIMWPTISGCSGARRCDLAQPRASRCRPTNGSNASNSGETGLGARSAVFSVRPIPAHRQQPPRRTAGESAGVVERQHEPAVGQ